jgi:hypothetical protein
VSERQGQRQRETETESERDIDSARERQSQRARETKTETASERDLFRIATRVEDEATAVLANTIRDDHLCFFLRKKNWIRQEKKIGLRGSRTLGSYCTCCRDFNQD